MPSSGKEALPQVCCAGYCGECSDYPLARASVDRPPRTLVARLQWARWSA